MGSGATEIAFVGRPNPKGPDFDLKVAIGENTDMKSMNNFWRSYGNFDVVAGQFSFFSEVSVRNGSVERLRQTAVSQYERLRSPPR